MASGAFGAPRECKVCQGALGHQRALGSIRGYQRCIWAGRECSTQDNRGIGSIKGIRGS